MGKKKTPKGIGVKKEENFSEWYSELVKKAELADLRYNVKGFVCYRPWAAITIKKMFDLFEECLERKGHLPIVMPSLIPESNFKKEAEHVEGFTPEVFWVTEAGESEKFEEKLALRPTSETAIYPMYSYWIRSYNDLPFKRYQAGQVWRYEGKSTRPFLRAREFHWIEAHNVFASKKEALNQVKEDMETTKEMLTDEFGLSFIFFERPQWDKFSGAESTYAADALMDSGRVIQLPSTHFIGQGFAKVFDVKFKDKDGKEKYGYITCYGPAISRIFGAMIAIHGDDQGLVLPFKISPLQVVVVPIVYDEKKKEILSKAEKIGEMLSYSYRVKVDERDDISPGEKFNIWEMKGVPFRIEIGPKDLENNQAVIVRRYDGKKFFVGVKELEGKLRKLSEAYTKELRELHQQRFENLIEKCHSIDEVKKAINRGKIACAGFCSIDHDGEKCAEVIEKETGGKVRGCKLDKEDISFDKCIVCGKKAHKTVYIAKDY
jgi:prolyl-tRNA synthetase